MPESVSRRSSVGAMAGIVRSYGAPSFHVADRSSENAARSLDRVERDAATRVDVLTDGTHCRVELASRERVDDVAVLGDEVLMALDVAPANHLHHQVDRELPVEARKECIAGEVDLVLVEGRVGRIPLLVRDRSVGSLQERGEAGQLARVEAADGAL